MSDNFAENFLKGDTHGIPNWVWLLIIAGGLGVGWIVKNKISSSQQSGTGTGITATGTGPVNTGTDQPPIIPVPPVPVPPVPTQPSNIVTVGGGGPNDPPSGSTVQQVANKYGLGYAQICSLNSWLKCGQPVVAGGAYDFNLPGNVDGKQFRIGP